MRTLWLLAALALIGAAPAGTEQGVLPDGATWKATIPANWNGTLLLWSHGYQAAMRPAEDAPERWRAALIEAGYAVAGSSYAQAGWALEQAPGDQLATLAAFTARHGRPRRVIAWGSSMGGLVTGALVERPTSGIDGGLALCASIGGAIGMMNMALDGAYAFKALLAPDSDIRLVGVDDDRVNAARVKAVLDAAQTTPEGRARIALAGVFAGLPGWTSADEPKPAPADIDAQQAEIARAFILGVFLPRTDQEVRAGGVFSWNSGVDYRTQLARSGRRTFVDALYRKAGLSVDADLARLNAGPRIAAEPSAIAYIMRNYTPDARPRAPIALVQNIGDGQTSPSLQRAYAEAAGAGASSLWFRGAGHCTFSAATVLAGLHHLEARLDTGRWPARGSAFVKHTPPPMLRPCVRGGKCR